MATHGMIDIETLDGEPDSVVITLGAMKFDPTTNAEPHAPLYLRLDIEEQSEKYKRSIDDNTLEWWGKQKKEIRRLLQHLPYLPYLLQSIIVTLLHDQHPFL